MIRKKTQQALLELKQLVNKYHEHVKHPQVVQSSTYTNPTESCFSPIQQVIPKSLEGTLSQVLCHRVSKEG